MVQNSSPSFNSIHIFDLANNHLWGMDCVVLKQKNGKVDLITAVSTYSGLTILYQNSLNAIFIRTRLRKPMMLHARILQSWQNVKENEYGPVRMTVRGPEPTVSVFNGSGQNISKGNRNRNKGTETHVLRPGEVSRLVNMNQVKINRLLVDGAFMIASAGIAGVVHIFQAKGELL